MMSCLHRETTTTTTTTMQNDSNVVESTTIDDVDQKKDEHSLASMLLNVYFSIHLFSLTKTIVFYSVQIYVYYAQFIDAHNAFVKQKTNKQIIIIIIIMKFMFVPFLLQLAAERAPLDKALEDYLKITKWFEIPNVPFSNFDVVFVGMIEITNDCKCVILDSQFIFID